MRIAHLSDLHFGKHDEELAEGLAAELSGQKPDLVVISGDFTQRGTAAEFEAARAFLDSLDIPFFAVPGNHDIPLANVMKRFVSPYGLYKRYISRDIEPFLELGGVALAGLRTSRRARLGLNWADGTISRDQLKDLEKRFAKASPDAIRIVVAHHPLMHPEEPMAKPMRRVKRADLALATFARLGVRLVLSGHFHMSYVRRHESGAEIAAGAPVGANEAAAAPVMVAQASTTISTRRRAGHLNAYNLIDIENGDVRVGLREWQKTGWMTRQDVTAKAAPTAETPSAAPAPKVSRGRARTPKS
ncbi:metallophosphoesterase [Chelativorans sp. ZYF759]|uniref:metallophosphoesterase family protein n=1 Tax=Chelativorans sp. ZYF759 TaxID=2692213 RepID=UPI00145C5E2C|nr:metallophosphoesterase [Chelativorans sp. ZYF759]NMG41212.1 metallophosphoesterase [Chelativorans sp. ZYF759]